MKDRRELSSEQIQLRDQVLARYFPYDESQRKLFEQAATEVFYDYLDQRNAEKNQNESITVDIFLKVKRETIKEKFIELEMERMYDEYLIAQSKDDSIPEIDLANLQTIILNALVAFAKYKSPNIPFVQIISETFPKNMHASVYALLQRCDLVVIDESKQTLKFKPEELKYTLREDPKSPTKTRPDQLIEQISERHKQQVVVSPEWGALKVKTMETDQAEFKRRLNEVTQETERKIAKLKKLRGSLELQREIEHALQNIPGNAKQTRENIKLAVFKKYKLTAKELGTDHLTSRASMLQYLDKLPTTIVQLKKEQPDELRKLNDAELEEALVKKIKQEEDDFKKFEELAKQLTAAVITFNTDLKALYAVPKGETKALEEARATYDASKQAIHDLLSDMNAFRKDKHLRVYSGGVALWSKLHQIIAEKLAQKFDRLTLESSLAGFLFDGLSWGTSWSTKDGAPMKAFWVGMSERIADTSAMKDGVKEDPNDPERGWVHLYALEEIVTGSAFYTDEMPRIEKYIKDKKLLGVKMFIYELEGNTRDRPIFILDKMPDEKDLSFYKDSYIFIKSPEVGLMYIQPTEKGVVPVNLAIKKPIDPANQIEGELTDEEQKKLDEQEQERKQVEQIFNEDLERLRSLPTDEKNPYQEKTVQGKAAYGSQQPLTDQAQALRNIIERNNGHQHHPRLVPKGEPHIIKSFADLKPFIKEVTPGQPSERFIKLQQRWQDFTRVFKRNWWDMIRLMKRHPITSRKLKEDFQAQQKQKAAELALPMAQKLETLATHIKDQVTVPLQKLDEDIKALKESDHFSSCQNQYTNLKDIEKKLDEMTTKLEELKKAAPDPNEQISNQIATMTEDLTKAQKDLETCLQDIFDLAEEMAARVPNGPKQTSDGPAQPSNRFIPTDYLDSRLEEKSKEEQQAITFLSLWDQLHDIVAQQLKAHEDYLDPHLWYRMSNLLDQSEIKHRDLETYMAHLNKTLTDFKNATDHEDKKYLGKKAAIYFDIFAAAIKDAQQAKEETPSKKFNNYVDKKLYQLHILEMKYRDTTLKRDYKALKESWKQVRKETKKNFKYLSQNIVTTDEDSKKYLMQRPKAFTSLDDFTKPFRELAEKFYEQTKKSTVDDDKEKLKKVKQNQITISEKMRTAFTSVKADTDRCIKDMHANTQKMQAMLGALKEIDDHIRLNPSMLFGEKKQMLRDLQKKLREAFFDTEQQHKTIGMIVSEWKCEHYTSKSGKLDQHISATPILLFSVKDDKTRGLIERLERNDNAILGQPAPVSESKLETANNLAH